MSYTDQEEKTNISILLELYRQACISSREYLNLRYKRFAIFVAITALIGAATFAIAELHPYHATVSAFGIVMTVLFWLLDYRTEKSFLAKQQRIKACEKLLGVVDYFIPDAEPQPGIPVAIIMHMIFATILLGWFAVEILIITTYEFV